MIAGVVIGFVGTAIGLTAVAGLICASFPHARDALAAPNRRRLGRDAVLALLAMAGYQLARRWLAGELAELHPGSTFFDISGTTLVASAVPALSILLGSASSALGWLAGVTAVVLAGRLVRPRWALLPVILLVAMAGVPGSVRTLHELAAAMGPAFLNLAWLALFCRWIARDNIVAYLLVAWALALGPPVAELMDTSARIWQLQGWLVIAVFTAVVVWLMCLRPRADPDEPS